MARQITVDLVSDTRDFERSMSRAGVAVDKFETDLKSADSAASRFDGAVDKVSGSLDNSTGKFRGTADLAGGLGNVLGIEVLGQAEMLATGFADMADGMGTLLAPALGKAKAAFAAMNATMLANPVFLVVAAITALTVAFVVAYKKSETFRNIVNRAFGAVKDGARAFSNAVVGAVEWAAKKLGAVAELITTPYRRAFNSIAWLWNNTIGRLSFSIPGWVPGIGGNGFDVPDIPMLAKGGIVNGPTLAMIGEAGPEAVVPLTGPHARGIGGATHVYLHLDGDRHLVEMIRKGVKDRGGNVQVVLGS